MDDTAQASLLQGPIDLLPAPFDGYEVALAVEVTDEKGDSYTERIDQPSTLVDLRASGRGLLLMFTVYGHFPAGGVHAFADAIVTDDGNPSFTYEAQRQYALRLARSIDNGHTEYGVDDMTFDEPDCYGIHNFIADSEDDPDGPAHCTECGGERVDPLPLMLALLIAALSIVAQPVTPPGDFTSAVLGDCHPVVEPGTFIGCEAIDRDETLYAGLIWVDGAASLQTGP